MTNTRSPTTTRVYALLQSVRNNILNTLTAQQQNGAEGCVCVCVRVRVKIQFQESEFVDYKSCQTLSAHTVRVRHTLSRTSHAVIFLQVSQKQRSDALDFSHSTNVLDKT